MTSATTEQRAKLSSELAVLQRRNTLASGVVTALLILGALGMAIATTLVVPPFLPALVRRAEGAQIVPAGVEGGPPAGTEDDDGIETPLPG